MSETAEGHTGVAKKTTRNKLVWCCLGAGLAIAVVALSLSARSSPTSRVVALTAAPAATIPAFCPAARTFVNMLPAIQLSVTDPARLPGLLNSAAPGITASSITSAPPAVQSDIATLTTAIRGFQTAMTAAGNQFSKLPPQQILALQNPTVEQAIGRLVRYVSNTCGPS